VDMSDILYSLPRYTISYKPCHLRNITEAKPQFLLSTTGWFLLATLGEICKLRREWGIGLSSMCFGAGFLLYIDCVFFIFGRLHENSGLKGSPSMFLLVAAPANGYTVLCRDVTRLGTHTFDSFVWYWTYLVPNSISNGRILGVCLPFGLSCDGYYPICKCDEHSIN